MWVHFATAGGVRAKSLPDLTPSSYECRDSGWEALCGYFSTLTLLYNWNLYQPAFEKHAVYPRLAMISYAQVFAGNG